MITSISNRQVSAAAKLKKRALREQQRRFLVEGAQPVHEALEAGAVETLLHAPDAGSHAVVRAARDAGLEVISVSERVMAHLTSTVTPQGLLGVARFVDVGLEAVPDEARLVPVLCAVRDPGNAGTVLRSADACGADAVVFSDASVDVYNPKTVRASAGSLFHLPVVRDAPAAHVVDVLRGKGFRVLAAEAEGSTSIYDTDLAGPTAILFGNEAWGLPPEVRDLADEGVSVPIRGAAESLNLAAAAAVILFEASRPRHGAGGEGVIDAVSASAHDLRSSLTALKGFSSMLVARWERFDDAARREMVRALSVDAERTGAVVRLLVDVSRVSRGGFRSSQEHAEIAETVRWLAEVFARTDDFPEVRVQGNATASVEPDRLQTVLLMLADALTWGGEGPIQARVRTEGSRATVELARSGAEPAELAAMIEMPRPKGRGKIGPWMARVVAEAMHGELTVGEEGSFLLRFPASD